MAEIINREIINPVFQIRKTIFNISNKLENNEFIYVIIYIIKFDN